MFIPCLYDYILLCDKCMNFPLSDVVPAEFWVLPRNRLAGMHVPPGGT